jgi:hypothetical protein
LTNKIREGLAKGADPKRIEVLIRQMVTDLEIADRLVRELDPAAPAGPGRDTSVILLADSLGSGVTESEVRELRKIAPGSSTARSSTVSEWLASSAKGLSYIKGAQLPATDGTAVIAEALRQGYRSYEVLDLGREVKRRENDFRAGRTTLRALREAIARGDRPDQLFRDSRPETVERPAAARPGAPTERPDRPTRPEVPQRPEQPVRPERPVERPGAPTR